jgi:hypothetical protein
MMPVPSVSTRAKLSEKSERKKANNILIIMSVCKLQDGSSSNDSSSSSSSSRYLEKNPVQVLVYYRKEIEGLLTFDFLVCDLSRSLEYFLKRKKKPL